MKVVLKQSVEDWFFGGSDYDYLSMNKLNKAITKCYLPALSPSPLKELLMKRLGTVKQLYLYLRVSCVDGTNIINSIRLYCDLKDDCERALDRWGIAEADWEAITDCMTTYFNSIGYGSIQCTTDEEIANYVKRLQMDVPLAVEYFEIMDK